MKTLNIGDLFVVDDGGNGIVYYCREYKNYASSGNCYVLIALNVDNNAIYSKKLIYNEDIERILSSSGWKYYSIVK